MRILLLSVLNAKSCTTQRPVTDVPHHWVYSTETFERVHLDSAEIEGSHYLLLVDSYSKWVDVFTMNGDCSTARTVDCLLAFIAAHGITKTLGSDNGPYFTSHAIKKFVTNVQRRTIPRQMIKQ